MPCGGPALPQADIDTIRRWIVGGSPFTVGDPHIRTVDGTGYDFQGAGEFVLLRDVGLELQARHAAVNTAVPLGPNAHTGLTSCVSINTAVAMRIGRDRVTYQPNLSGEPDPSGLQLRVNGELIQLGDQGFRLSGGGRITPTIAPGGIMVRTRGGSRIVVTPGWWAHHEVWFLNIHTENIRATEGLMGSIAPGNWLPALPDGTLLGPLPADLDTRFDVLYQKFGNAWRVAERTSLFDYAPGTSTADFTIEEWPASPDCEVPGPDARPPLPPMPRAKAVDLAANVEDPTLRAHLIDDLIATGDPVFARVYQFTDRIMGHQAPDVPVLNFPEDQVTGLDGAFAFRWDQPEQVVDDARVTYKLFVWHVDEEPDLNGAVPITDPRGRQSRLVAFRSQTRRGLFLEDPRRRRHGLHYRERDASLRTQITRYQPHP